MKSLFPLCWVAAYIGACTAAIQDAVNGSSFELGETVDARSSLDIMKNLSFLQYWDAPKSSFRTGLIGDLLSKSYPQFTSVLNTKMGRPGGGLDTVTTVVDQAALYMHGLSALQRVMESHDEMLALISPSIFYHHDLKSVIAENASLQEMDTAKRVFLAQQAQLRTSGEYYEALAISTQSVLHLRNTTKSSRLKQLHASVMLAVESQSLALADTIASKFSALQSLALTTEHEVRDFMYHASESERLGAVLALERDINNTMVALAYRAAAELETAVQQQTFEEKQLLDTKTELLRAEVEEVINTFFAEIVSCARGLTGDPIALLNGIGYALLAILALLTLFEAAQTVLAVIRKYSGASFLPQQVLLRPGGGRSERGSPLSCACHWSPTAGAQLDRVHAALTVSLEEGLPLPNVLVLGASGSGKSMLLNELIREVQAAVNTSARACRLLRVCGADLQALGDGVSTNYLSDLMRSSRGGALLLVLDDADSIIAMRQGEPLREATVDMTAHDLPSGKRGVGCFYALLTGLRQNYSYVGLIVASRLVLSAVDDALVDRVDHVVCLERPDEAQRLNFAVGALKHISGVADGDIGHGREVMELAESGALASALHAVHTAALPASLVAVVGCSAAQLATTRDVPVDPETDTPGHESAAVASQTDISQFHAVALRLRDKLNDFPDDSLDVLLCLRLTLMLSRGWSFRELKQLFTSLGFAAMCSDRCRLSTRMWVRELVYSTG